MDKYLEAIKEKRTADFEAQLFSKNSDNLNLERIDNVLAKNNNRARYSFLKIETNLADKSLQDALALGKHLGLIYQEGNLYIRDYKKHPNPTKYVTANLENWDARRLFIYKILPSKKFTPKQKAQYIAPFVRYLKNRSSDADLIEDKSQKQEFEHSVNYYFALSKEYHFEQELKDALKQITDPNDIETAKIVKEVMLDMYEKMTSPSQLKSDLKLTQEIFDVLERGGDISKFEKEI